MQFMQSGKNSNQRLKKEIALILIIKIIALLIIKELWFDSPTIPKNYDKPTSQHILGK